MQVYQDCDLNWCPLQTCALFRTVSGLHHAFHASSLKCASLFILEPHAQAHLLLGLLEVRYILKEAASDLPG